MLTGTSLAFLMLDGIIAYFAQTVESISKFRESIIHLTLFSGFAGTFAYLFISPIFMSLTFRISILLSAFLIILFMILSMAVLSKKYNKVQSCKNNKSVYKNLISISAFTLTVLMTTQGVIQTIVFFELIMFFLVHYESQDIIFISYAFIGISQVFGRLIIYKFNNLDGFDINLISASFMFVSVIFCILSIYYNIYLLLIFAVIFGMGLGMSTVCKPLVISQVFESDFSFYNGFYSLVLNLSRAAIPLLLILIPLSITNLLIILIIFSLYNVIGSYLLLTNHRI